MTKFTTAAAAPLAAKAAPPAPAVTTAKTPPTLPHSALWHTPSDTQIGLSVSFTTENDEPISLNLSSAEQKRRS